jgi:hypothetical protein
MTDVVIIQNPFIKDRTALEKCARLADPKNCTDIVQLPEPEEETRRRRSTCPPPVRPRFLTVRHPSE